MLEITAQDVDFSSLPDQMDTEGLDLNVLPDQTDSNERPSLAEVTAAFTEAHGKPFDPRYVADLLAMGEATGLHPDIIHQERGTFEGNVRGIARPDEIFADAKKRRDYLPDWQNTEKGLFTNNTATTASQQALDVIEAYGQRRDTEKGRMGLQAVWDAEAAGQLKHYGLPDSFFFSPVHLKDALGPDLPAFLDAAGIPKDAFEESLKGGYPQSIHATDLIRTEPRAYLSKLRGVLHDSAEKIPGPELTFRRAGGALVEAGKQYAKDMIISQKATIDALRRSDDATMGEALKDPGLAFDLAGKMQGSTFGEQRKTLNELSAALGNLADKIERDPRYLESSGLIEDLINQTPQVAASMAAYLTTSGILKGGVAALSRLADVAFDATKVAKVGAAAGAVAGTGLMFNQILGNTYGDLIKQNVPEDRAFAAGFINAAIQAPLEKIGLQSIMKGWAPKLSIGKKLLAIAEAFGKESLTEGLQEYPDQWTRLWAGNGDLTTAELLSKAIQQLPKTAKDSAYSALVGGIMGVAGTTVGTVTSSIAERGQAKTSQDQLVTILQDLQARIEAHAKSKPGKVATTRQPGAIAPSVDVPAYVEPPVSDGRTKVPLGYQIPEGRSLADETRLVMGAMSHAESGGRYDAVDQTGGQGYGRYQYEPGTWSDYSKEYTQALFQEATVLPMTPENQDAVTEFKVQQFLERGYSPKQIFAIWNSGSADWVGKVGVNRKTGARYDVPGHVYRANQAYEAIAAGKPIPIGRREVARALGAHKGLSPVQVDKAMAVMDAAANSWADTYGREAEEWYGGAFADVEVGGEFRGGLTQYAGPNAMGWDEATGKFSSLYDKKPRFEIDDSEASINPVKKWLKATDMRNDRVGGYGASLDTVWNHPTLFDNYPFLRDTRVLFGYGNEGASASASQNAITLPRWLKKSRNVDYDKIKKVLSHEVQHLVQSHEGHATGTSIDDLDYWENAGEIEARDAAARANLTPEQRAKMPPYSSEKITPEDAIVKFGERLTLKQGEASPKGAVQFLDDGRAVLSLFEAADVSTIIHELGHILRRQLSTEDRATIEAWAGVEGGRWDTAAEEKFARAFERYVMEGKAPSWRLKEVFSKLKKWLLDIYGSVSALNVEIPDEVRDVFDRLLTTEQQRKTDVLFQMDDDYSWVEPAAEEIPVEAMTSYEQVAAEASRRAHASLEGQIERNRKIRDAQWRKKARAQLAEDFTWKMIGYIKEKGGLSLESVRAEFGDNMVKALAQKYPGIISAKGTLTLNQMAADNGIEGDDALAQALLSFPSKAEYVESYVENMQRESDTSEAEDLMDWQERYIAEEIDIFNKLLGPEFSREERQPKGIKAKIREVTGQVKVGAAMEGGDYKNLVAGMKMAARAARQAFSEGKINGARKEKVRQRELMNRARALLNAKKEAKKIQAELKRWVNDKKIDPEYKEQLANLLGPYEFRGRSKKTQARLDALAEFMARKDAEGEAVNIPRALLERLTKKPIGQLTLDELRELRDVAAQIVHLGKLKKQLIDRKAARDFDQVLRSVLTAIREKARNFQEPLGYVTAPSERRPTGGKLSQLFATADQWHTQLLQVEFLVKMMDGFEDNGPCYQALFLPVKHAEDEKWVLLEQIAKKWDEIRAPVRKQMKTWATETVAIPGFNRMLTREEHLMIALHSRHADNRAALVGGNKFTEAEIQAVVDSLTPDESAFLDRVVNELIPIPKTLLQDTYRKLHGIPLKVVQGDYVPMKFDREVSEFIDDRKKEAEAVQYFKDFFSGVYQEKGMTIERKGGKQPLLLSFMPIFEHLSDTVQFASHGLAVRNLLKMIEHRAFKETLTAAHGKNVVSQLKPWLKEVASPGSKPLLPLEGVLGKIRRNSTMFIMAYRYSTAIQQPLALLNTIDEIGVGATADAAGRYLKNWDHYREFIRSRSPAIRNRSSSFERDISTAAREFDINKSEWREGYENTAFAFTGFLDGVAAEITWLGAYTKAINGTVGNIGAGDEATAIDYADGVVNRTQGSGTAKNLAIMSRGTEAHKLFITFFYTFFNTYHNRMWQRYQQTRLPGSEYNVLDGIKSLFLMVLMPAIVGDLLSGKLPEPKESGKAVARYLVSGIPLARDAMGALTGYEYRGGLFGSMLKEVGAIGRTLASDKDKQKAWHVMKRVMKIGGYATGFPPDQALILLEAAMEDRNKTFSPFDLTSRRTHRE